MGTPPGLDPSLGAGREFDLIRAIAEALGDRAQGLGDDCAILELGATRLAVSVDTSLEGVHFRRAWLEPAEIGWRAAAAALSDLAAVGAVPAGVLVALTIPATDAALAVPLMEGVGAVAQSVGAKVLGGDLTHGGPLALAVTVLGHGNQLVGRRGAKAGDGLWVTGALGGARAALHAWEAGVEPDPAARRAFAMPTPRIGAGRWLAGAGARALIDLSDGLASDLRHLIAASEVGAIVDLDHLPIGPDVAAAAERVGETPGVFAARGGEDYELVVALPPEFGPLEAGAFEAELGLPLTRVGAVTAGNRLTLLDGGRPTALVGYDHFA